MNRANFDAIGGRPHPHDIFVRKYAQNKHAAQLADYYRRTTPAMQPPRTAAYFAHYYGVSVPGATGTEGQMALLRHVRRQQEHIQAIRNSPEPRGVHHNPDPTAQHTLRPEALTPIPEPDMEAMLADMRPAGESPTPQWVLDQPTRKSALPPAAAASARHAPTSAMTGAELWSRKKITRKASPGTAF